MSDPSGLSGSMLLDDAAAQTDWSLIAAAVDEPGWRGLAMERLSRRYWPAIYAYCRSIGLPPDKAADATQGFVCDVVLDRGLLAVADPTRGRFRNLLLTAVSNYVRDRHRRDARQQRSPRSGPPVSLDAMREPAGEATARTPEEAFTAQWASTLVRDVLEQARVGCAADGLEAHWAVFEARVARPLLLGDPPLPYHGLLERFGIKDVSRAANMVITVKRRVAALLRAEVARTIEDPDELEAELAQLLRALECSS